MKKFLAIILFLIIFSCGITKSNETAKIGTTEYAIFSYDANEKYPLFKNAKPTSLTKFEVAEIEKIVGDKIEKIIANHNQNKVPKDSYVRQYVPAINEYGEKLVWINVFCNFSGDQTWKKSIIEVSDGGDCAFQLKLNLKTNDIFDFRINMIS